MSTYLNDQLKEDIERDELVARGQLTRDQADEQAEEWAEVSPFGSFFYFFSVFSCSDGRVERPLLKSKI